MADLAFIKTSQSVPVVAKMGKDPKEGLRVAAVGYPLGGPWSLSQGRIRQYIDGDSYGIGHRVLLFDATVEPGNSGGPLMDRDGLVVGVVFAKSATARSLASLYLSLHWRKLDSLARCSLLFIRVDSGFRTALTPILCNLTKGDK